MRVNEPITDHESEVPEGQPLTSRTGRSGNIVFTNHVFVETGLPPPAHADGGVRQSVGVPRTAW